MPTLLSKTQKNKATSKLAGGQAWFIAAIVVTILGAIAVFFAVSQATAQITYYVLNQDVAARTQITEGMLTPVSTNAGGQPRNALDVNYIQTEDVYAKYALDAGDVPTLSNTGPLSPITEGIPEDYVVASFVAPAEYAVAGKIKRGDYINIIANSESDVLQSKLVLSNVLVLDATNGGGETGSEEVAAEESAETPASESAAVRTGIPTVYTVGLSVQDAVKLAAVKDLSLLVTLAPVAVDENVDATTDLGTIMGQGGVGNSGAGTDSTFGEDAPENAEGSEAPAEAPASEAPAEAPASEAPAEELPPADGEEPTE